MDRRVQKDCRTLSPTDNGIQGTADDFGPDLLPGTGDEPALPEGAFNERFEYDDRGRQTKITQDADGDLNTTADQRVVDNSYDDQGRLIEVGNDEGVLTYAYEGRDKRCQEP